MNLLREMTRDLWRRVTWAMCDRPGDPCECQGDNWSLEQMNECQPCRELLEQVEEVRAAMAKVLPPIEILPP